VSPYASSVHSICGGSSPGRGGGPGSGASCRSPLRLRRRRTTAASAPRRATSSGYAYADSTGFLTLLSDGDRLTGAYALGPEAGEWLQQATLAIRARVPLDVLRDTIQPFPTFSEIYVGALKALDAEIASRRPAAAVAS
jgi:hypothetical protein